MRSVWRGGVRTDGAGKRAVRSTGLKVTIDPPGIGAGCWQTRAWVGRVK
ncbi:MAG: hypothetical protein KF768_12350 [Phycisphaeraceae bacterium]|nr:hypothetical protein [Phycisphaeraceae bacterium]